MDISGGIVGILVVLIIFGSIASMIILPMWFRERTKQSAHHLLGQALEKGQQLDPETVQRLTQSVQAVQQQQQARPRRTLGNGIVLLALGVGFLASDYWSDHEFDLKFPTVILLALGAAFTLLALVDYVTGKKSDN